MWQHYLQPATLAEALGLLAQQAGTARLVAGGTDVIVEMGRGIRKVPTLIDISRLHELKYVAADGDRIRLGGLATHNDVLASRACAQGALPLFQACLEVGAPQIRTRATIAGNLVTASPANDTIPPLLALDAELVLASASGERVLALADFYTGFRRTALAPDELIREIRFAPLVGDRQGIFIKLGLRRAQAISVINLALVVTLEPVVPGNPPVARDARIVLGCVAPTVVRVPGAETFLEGRVLDRAACEEAGRRAVADVAPIGDVRGSAEYRRTTVASVVAGALLQLATGDKQPAPIDLPVLLDTGERSSTGIPFAGQVDATINGQPYTLANAQGKTLLQALREDAGLTGTKEGCAEGECGACTVWLDGQAVMACLVPAPQAHGASITTIEGLARQGQATTDGLHPLQQAFIDHGAVQCGYCIPGILMAGAKVLQERPQADLADVQVAFSGNICRCTGYRKILAATLAAAGSELATVE